MVAQARRRQKPPLRAAKGTRSGANAGDARRGRVESAEPTRHSRKPPSFPQATVISASHRHSRGRGNPEKNKSRRLPSPSQSEGDAERSERRGCPWRSHPRSPTCTAIPANHRHSRARGNPEKNKSRRLPSPSRSEGDAERSERRGCPWRNHPISLTFTVIPAKAGASADGTSIQRGREATVSPLPRWERARVRVTGAEGLPPFTGEMTEGQ